MEDAHATILELDDKEKNAFFAVYDGHGGTLQNLSEHPRSPEAIYSWSFHPGGSIAKYSGQHVHQRLAGDEAYNAKDYKTAFKKAFLGTDDDLRTGSSLSPVQILVSNSKGVRSRLLSRSFRMYRSGCASNDRWTDLLREDCPI